MSLPSLGVPSDKPRFEYLQCPGGYPVSGHNMDVHHYNLCNECLRVRYYHALPLLAAALAGYLAGVFSIDQDTTDAGE